MNFNLWATEKQYTKNITHFKYILEIFNIYLHLHFKKKMNSCRLSQNSETNLKF